MTGLEELRQLTVGALAEMRTLLLELRPASLTRSSMTELLQQLKQEVETYRMNSTYTGLLVDASGVPDFELADPGAVTWSTGQVRGPRTLPVTIP